MKKEKGHYQLLLAAVIIARSSAYLFSKICLASMGPFTLLALRFSLAFALLAALFGRRLKQITPHTALRGAVLGAIFFSVMTAELLGLRTTASSTASFLENTAIVLVPLLEAALCKKAPRGKVLLSCALALCGIAFLSVKDGAAALHSGELLCLLAACLYAAGIITTDRFSHEDDPLALGIVQVGVIALLGAASAFLFESPQLPDTSLEWVSVVYLAVVCSGFGFALQPLAQSHTSAERAGIFCALNPLSAAVLGAVFLGERFSPANLVGAALIAGSIVIYGKSRGSALPAARGHG